MQYTEVRRLDPDPRQIGIAAKFAMAAAMQNGL
jgi:hypothetical protein